MNKQQQDKTIVHRLAVLCHPKEDGAGVLPERSQPQLRASLPKQPCEVPGDRTREVRLFTIPSMP